MRTLSGLWIDRSARPTLQDQLARQIRERIRNGDLAPGDPLPSTRDLASELKLSRNTAVYAYERLMEGSMGTTVTNYSGRDATVGIQFAPTQYMQLGALARLLFHDGAAAGARGHVDLAVA